MSRRQDHLAIDEFDRRLSRLAVATADQSDPLIDSAVNDVLRLVREILEMDVAFVSHFEDGRRVFRNVEAGEGKRVIAVGGSDPLELSFCQRVVDGRLPELVQDVAKLPDVTKLPPAPFPVGAHLSTPLVLGDGTIYGTLCCFSFAPNKTLTAERDLKRLHMAARLAARLVDQGRARAGL
jgi:GAF domain-containing protein